jgi:ABC-type transport system involved in multi-copper enzyme maturation permease subunit
MNPMNHVLVIARDTVKGFVAQRLFLALSLGVLAAALLFANFVSNLESNFEQMNGEKIAEIQKRAPKSQGKELDRDAAEMGLEQLRSIQYAFFFGGASAGGTAVSLLLFATLLAVPLRRGETRGVLSRPVERTSYVVGRVLGATAVLAVYWLLLGAVFWYFAWRTSSPLSLSARVAAVLYFSKNLMVGSIALALSLYVRPAVAAGIAVVANSDWTSSKTIVYYLLPGDERLGVASQLMSGTVLDGKDLALGVAYALNVAAVAIGIGLLRFRKLDLV